VDNDKGMNELVNNLLTGGVAVALITLVGQLVMWWVQEGRKENDGEVPVGDTDSDQYEDKIEIQQIIDRVITNSGANRFLILKTENGGGKPRLGSHLYASVLYESNQPPLTNVKED